MNSKKGDLIVNDKSEGSNQFLISENVKVESMVPFGKALMNLLNSKPIEFLQCMNMKGKEKMISLGLTV